MSSPRGPIYAAGTALAALVLLLAAALFAHRLRAAQRRHEQLATARALAEERRRMAADVHDLIMQELSFALTNARALVDDPKLAPQARAVVAAAERALGGARDVVANL
ncbi:MAG: histidine kinase, partial [Solirubrobacterales bacterium]|nr:histidine kinase [Solirubrobacterales bacterium]